MSRPTLSSDTCHLLVTFTCNASFSDIQLVLPQMLTKAKGDQNCVRYIPAGGAPRPISDSGAPRRREPQDNVLGPFLLSLGSFPFVGVGKRDNYCPFLPRGRELVCCKIGGHAGLQILRQTAQICLGNPACRFCRCKGKLPISDSGGATSPGFVGTPPAALWNGPLLSVPRSRRGHLPGLVGPQSLVRARTCFGLTCLGNESTKHLGPPAR